MSRIREMGKRYSMKKAISAFGDSQPGEQGVEDSSLAELCTQGLWEEVPGSARGIRVTL